MRLPESIVLTRSTMLCGRISQRVEQLDVELATAEATSAAWRDLVSSAEKVKRKVEEVSFRRDTLYAIAKHRTLMSPAASVSLRP
jgi:hypothetical protein